jgi:myo-inositol 2-dehydrogenase/D-chiro-inositol 1-dehydrogenase/UDP-N-acetylglucosamine 3-dehydrogenase
MVPSYVDDQSIGGVQIGTGSSTVAVSASGHTPFTLGSLEAAHAVAVATPAATHFDLMRAALEAGKHVLVEKPLAVSPEDAWTLAAAGNESGKVFTVCHSLRFSARYALMRKAVVEGRVGEVVHVYARRNSLQPAVDRVIGRFPLPYWLAPHDIDMMLWTVGSRAVSVKAWSRAGAATRSDFVMATIQFENGASGVIETSWCTPGFSGRPLNELFTVRGDAGMIEVIGYEQGLAVYNADSTVEYPDTCHMPPIHGQTEGPYRSLLRHFAGAVRDLWPPLITAAEAAAVIDVAYAIERSLKTGTEIEVTKGGSAPGS